MLKRDFFYHLPEELIAQHPMEPRDASRLLHLSRDAGEVEHLHFNNLPSLLRAGDCLVINDTKVLPARLCGEKSGGGTVEFLLLKSIGASRWEALAHPGKKARAGERFAFGDGSLTAEVSEVLANGNRVLDFSCEGDFFALLEQIGEMPLPHYIKEKIEDGSRYQTVYARESGSAAAPTAGLHFTPELLDKIRVCGVNIGKVTLHVGVGTFRPVKAERVEEHVMHTEHYRLPEETAALIRRTKAEGGRVICVGTTSCRTVESVAASGEIRAAEGDTEIFIYPGYEFRCMDGLITNFHLPESTLIMLVAAFAGYERTMETYRVAVEERYRFYSFGDAMFID